jgi:L-fuculose-phosphate aldolase
MRQVDDLAGRRTEEALATLRDELLHAYHILDGDGQSYGVAGHLTARLPGADRFWSHHYGLGFDEVQAGDLLEADFGLRTVSGEARVNPSLNVHTEIYRARPDVNCIIHTHGRASIALGAVGATLEPITQSGCVLFDDVAIHDEYGGIVLDESEGQAIARVLGSRHAVLLKNHGALVAGPSVRAATIAAIVLEWAADIQLRAMAAGTLRRLPETAAREAKAFINSPKVQDLRWAHLVRAARRRRPDVFGA